MESYREKNREKIREYVAGHRVENREHIRERERLRLARVKEEAQKAAEQKQKIAERKRKDSERAQRWNEANPEKARANRENWKKRHPDALKESQQRYYAANKEKRKAAAKEAWQKDPQKHRDNNKKWREANKEKINQAARDRVAKETPEQREKRLAVTREKGRLRTALAQKDLPPPRTRRPPAWHVEGRAVAAKGFFEKQRSAAEISQLRSELSGRLRVSDAKAQTSPDALRAWQQSSRLAAARFTRDANMAVLAQRGELGSRVEVIAARVAERSAARFREAARMDSRAGELRGKAPLNIDAVARREIMAEARKRLEKELQKPPVRGSESEALKALNALRASYPQTSLQKKSNTPPSPTRHKPKPSPRQDRGHER